MSDIVDKILAISGLLSLGGCSDEQIKEAEEKLGLVFPAEYKDYVKQFGAISFTGTEWTGLNAVGYLNVITETLTEKERYDSFPEKHFVLENLGIDGILVICDEEGKVFSFNGDKESLLTQSISEYLDQCIEANTFQESERSSDSDNKTEE